MSETRKKQPDLTIDQLKRATDERSWQRGMGYARDARVYSLLVDGGNISAKVHGTEDYMVQLWLSGDEIQGECSCPTGASGVFCKHCVAAGLVYLHDNVDDEGGEDEAGRTHIEPHAGKRGRRRASVDDIRQYLSRQETPKLVEIIIQQMKEDDGLRESLLMKVACQRPGPPDLAAFRQAIRSATDTGGFVDYHSAYDFAKGIDNMVESIADVLEKGHGDAAIALTEYALQRCEEAVAEMDDSDGYMRSIFERLEEIHHTACLAARPEPQALARRLFEWELNSDWEVFYGAVQDYADVFGDVGVSAYRALAEKEWNKLPKLGPGDDQTRYEGVRFRLTSIMEFLARMDGDVDALVAVKSRDLSTAYQYLQIAEIYKEAEQSDQALEWAERGLAAFSDRADNRLREFLAAEYQCRGRRDDALAQVWAIFVDHLSLPQFQQLSKYATAAKQWPKWREKAILHIRKDITDRKKESKGNRWAWSRVDHSLIVEILLWEQNVNAAWEEARSGGCSDSLWMRLAQLREEEHPQDTLGVYMNQVEPIIAQKHKHTYEEAVELIRRIRELMKRLDREQEFTEYLASVRAKHRRKRNFMALLDRVE